jgi:putative CocE/NonD family hydrolase
MDIIVEKNLSVDAGDGTNLATDVYRPAGGAPVPALVLRSPYNKERLSQGDTLRIVQAGFAVVSQDTRGSFASAGAFRPFAEESGDGAATIAWAAAQPWSSGKVGSIGASYVGATQWLAAATAPPALLAMAPSITAVDYYDCWTYQGGAFQLGFNLSWAHSFALAEVQRRPLPGHAAPAANEPVLTAIDDIQALYAHLPLVDMPLLRELAPYYIEWLEHPSYDSFWRRIAPRETYGRVTAPALNIGGWFDGFLRGTLANYRGMKQQGGSEVARRQQRLLIGPWSHGNFGGFFQDRAYGIRAAADVADLTGAQIRWFDRWLKGIDNGVDQERPVRIFVMGINRWREEDDWPLPDTQFRPYYLHSAGTANSVAGTGALSTEPPGDEPEDAYLYDPRRPVPTTGGATLLPGGTIAANAGPRDQHEVERRDDVLCYTTPPLARPLEVTGPIELVLYAASSARDTDFTGALVDVAPDGRALLLTDGILRARYRESFSAPALLEPHRIYELRLDLGATSMVFGAGHHLRLMITSSNFPRFDRNSNTGGDIAREGIAEFKQAINRVYHDGAHPSHLLLPCIERE